MPRWERFSCSGSASSFGGGAGRRRAESRGRARPSAVREGGRFRPAPPLGIQGFVEDIAGEVLSRGAGGTTEVNASPRGIAGAWRCGGWVLAAVLLVANAPARANGSFPDEFS